jgi:anti-sigma factor ChrR (cupin superfamily)
VSDAQLLAAAFGGVTTMFGVVMAVTRTYILRLEKRVDVLEGREGGAIEAIAKSNEAILRTLEELLKTQERLTDVLATGPRPAHVRRGGGA